MAINSERIKAIAAWGFAGLITPAPTPQSGLAADDLDVFFDIEGLAEMVIYRVGALGAGIIIPAVISYGGNPVEKGRYLVEEMTALISQAAVASPQNGDTITLADDSVWTVRGRPSGGVLGVGWSLRCTKGERAAQRGAGA